MEDKAQPWLEGESSRHGRTLRRCAVCMGWPSISTEPVRLPRLSMSSAEPDRMDRRVDLPQPAGPGRVGDEGREPTQAQQAATCRAAAGPTKTPHAVPEGPSTPTSSPLAATPLTLRKMGLCGLPPTSTVAAAAAGAPAEAVLLRRKRGSQRRPWLTGTE